MYNATKTAPSPLFTLDKLARKELAGIFFDVMYVKELQKGWQQSMAFLLQAFCEGDLPLFLAHVREVTLRFHFSGGKLVPYCAPLLDKTIALRLLKVAHFFLNPLVQAWELTDTDEALDLFHDILLIPRQNGYQQDHRANVTSLYERCIAFLLLQEKVLTSETSLQKQDSVWSLRRLLSENALTLSDRSDPTKCYNKLHAWLEHEGVMTKAQFDNDHRALFVALYHEDSALHLSSQISLLADMQEASNDESQAFYLSDMNKSLLAKSQDKFAHIEPTIPSEHLLK